MKIAFLSLYSDLTNYGLRVISSYLKQNDHETIILNIPIEDKHGNPDKLNFKNNYSETQLKSILDIVKNVDLVGISLMSQYFYRAKQITEFFKKNGLKVPVMWGGIHPTVLPDECIKHCDIVAIGECEEALLELANSFDAKKKLYNINNFWFKVNGKIIKNGVRPLIKNIDKYPFPDYDLKSNYILKNEKMVPLKPEDLKKRARESVVGNNLVPGYRTVTTRGCPYACTYCVNSALRKIYHGQSGFVRNRNPKNIIDELIWIKKKFNFFKYISIVDDTFMAKSYEDIKEFSVLYKEKINLPFGVAGSPFYIEKRKIDPLIEAGLIKIGMGIQSGSEHLLKNIYRRYVSNEQTIKATKIISSYGVFKRYAPKYDLIVDCVYESNQDIIDTLKLLKKIARPFHLATMSMTPFHGTELYDMQKKDKLIKNEDNQIFFKPIRKIERRIDYPMFVLLLLKNHSFSKFVPMLCNKYTIKILNRKSLIPLYEKIIYRKK